MNELTQRIAIIAGALTSMFWCFNMRACTISDNQERIAHDENYANGYNMGYQSGLDKAKEIIATKEAQ